MKKDQRRSGNDGEGADDTTSLIDLTPEVLGRRIAAYGSKIGLKSDSKAAGKPSNPHFPECCQYLPWSDPNSSQGTSGGGTRRLVACSNASAMPGSLFSSQGLATISKPVGRRVPLYPAGTP